MIRRVWKRGALAGMAALLLQVALATGVLAHAELTGTDPVDGAVLEGAPERVQLFFSEPIEPEFYALEVYASDRKRVDRGDARISPTDARVVEVELPEAGGDTYTVVWRVLLLDSHVIRGVFSYTVGAGASPAQPINLALPDAGAPFPAESAARWLTFLATFVLLGGFAFRPLVLAPVLRAAGLDQTAVEQGLLRRWLWLAWVSAALMLPISFAALVFQASSAAGIPLGDVLGGSAITRVLTGTKYGALWLARVGLVLGMVGVLAWLSAASVGRRRGVAWWLGTALASAVLLTLSATGHASAVQKWTQLAILADWAHLLAGGVWVGGLVQLGLALPAALREADGDARRQLLGRLVPRFSRLAGLSVATLVLSGTYSALQYVPTWPALLDTAYGAALSGKLLLVAPLLGLGALNLLVLHPRFRRAAAPVASTPPPRGRRRGRRAEPVREVDDAGGRRAFRLLVLAEAALAVAVLAVSGVLTGLPPATSLLVGGKPFTETQRTATYALTLSVQPNQAGPNRLEVALVDQQGAPVADAERVRLTISMLDMEGAREVDAQRVEPGRYEVRGIPLSMAGRWQADVAVLRAEQEEQARFAFLVADTPDDSRPAFSPGRVVLLALNERSALALYALAAAVPLLAWGRGLRRPGQRRQAGAVAAALLVAGMGMGGVSVAEAYRFSLPNPVPASAVSLARGEQVYQEAGCASCHGVSGRGDGPAGRGLRPRPADFRTHMAADHTDRRLFEWISDGVGGTAMTGYRDHLREEDRWDLVNYLRTLAGTSAY
jgi:copper transport protein